MHKKLDDINNNNFKGELKPFFIFYAPRSGSTLLSRFISEKLGCVIPPESRFLPKLLNFSFSKSSIKRAIQLIKILKEDIKFTDWNISVMRIFFSVLCFSDNDNKSLIEIIMRLYSKQKTTNNGSVYFGFKKDNYRKYFREIKIQYPNVKFICIIRDGRAVFNSQKNSLHSETGVPFETDPVQAAKAWVDCINDFKSIRNLYPNDTFFIKYENFINNINDIMEQIAQFLEININGSSSGLSIDYTIPLRYSKLHKNVNRPPMIERTDAWKSSLSKEEIRLYEEIALKVLNEQGYKSFFSE